MIVDLQRRIPNRACLRGAGQGMDSLSLSHDSAWIQSPILNGSMQRTLITCQEESPVAWTAAGRVVGTATRQPRMIGHIRVDPPDPHQGLRWGSVLGFAFIMVSKGEIIMASPVSPTKGRTKRPAINLAYCKPMLIWRGTFNERMRISMAGEQGSLGQHLIPHQESLEQPPKA